MSNVDGPPESPSIVHVELRLPSRISSAQLATPVDHVFARACYSPPPPDEKTLSGVVASPPKGFASPPEAVASPPKLEPDDVRSVDE